MSGTVLHHISISVLDYLWLYCFQKKPHIEGLLYTVIPCNTELAEATFDNTWIIHLCKNYRSKSETAINIAGCLNVRRFQFFSPLQFPHFRLLICFAVSSGFFAVSLGFFAVSKPANACKMTNMQKLFGGRKTCRQQ